MQESCTQKENRKLQKTSSYSLVLLTFYIQRTNCAEKLKESKMRSQVLHLSKLTITILRINFLQKPWISIFLLKELAAPKTKEMKNDARKMATEFFSNTTTDCL